MLPALNNEHRAIIDNSIKHDWSVPEFKVKHFIAGSHIHPLHKIKQYLMELGSRYDNLELFEADIERLQIEIELEKELIDRTDLQAQKKLHELEIRLKERKLAVSREKVRTAAAEVDKFLKLIDEFNASEEGKDERGVLYMDVMKDPVECERIEAKYWEYRLAKQAALDMIAYGRIGVGNMEAIMQLDADGQNKCLAMAYEVLLTNESRMSQISDKVVGVLSAGKSVSDINNLLNIQQSEFSLRLSNQTQEQSDVPLIQKR